MNHLTKKQKRVLKNYMVEIVKSKRSVSSNDLVNVTALNVPFANRHHISGMINGLKVQGILDYQNGVVS